MLGTEIDSSNNNIQSQSASAIFGLDLNIPVYAAVRGVSTKIYPSFLQTPSLLKLKLLMLFKQKHYSSIFSASKSDPFRTFDRRLHRHLRWRGGGWGGGEGGWRKGGEQLEGGGREKGREGKGKGKRERVEPNKR